MTKSEAFMGRAGLAALLAGAVLGGCSTTPVAPPAASVSQYRCDRNIAFAVRFGDDSAAIDSATLGKEMLLRDAGGLTPQQTVYSNTRMRAEFGLGANGREAILRVAAPPLVARCAQH